MEEYCKWQSDIFRIMNKKGYTFEGIRGIKMNPIRYMFAKTKTIGENRYREFMLTISVYSHKSDSNCLSVEYRLELKDYSRNKMGYINNYWGKTPVVTAKSNFCKEKTDYNNLIKNIKYSRY